MKLHAVIVLFFSLNAALAAGQSDPTFRLGEISVIGQKSEAGDVDAENSSRVSRDEIQKHNKTDVGEALNLLPGVILSTNNRNEKLISVRGYDSRQVPLFIDGIPVYVPYDGYVDFARFTTADLSSLQVAKGFSSVSYGPNTLGGAINLISRRPVKPFEAYLTLGAGSGNEKRGSLNLGSLQERWYFQSGLSLSQADYFPMSEKYTPTTTEPGGARDNSYRKDSKVSTKVAFIPNASDEYALSFYSQKGEKGQPPSTDPARARYWQWPYWNKDSLYFVSQTAVSSAEILKVRLYQDRFDNEVNSFTNNTYSVPKLTGAGSIGTGGSIYHDVTHGGALNLESFRAEDHHVNVSFHFKQDRHRELDQTGLENTNFEDQLLFLGAEDAVKLSQTFTLSVGASQTRLVPKTVFSLGNPYSLPGDQAATDLQSALYYRPSSDTQWSLSLARKTRMPTLRDRYSARLGTFLQNPDLQPERALNFDLGYARQLSADSKWTAGVFLNNVDQKIQTVANVQGALSQMQNVGRAQVAGLELAAQSRLGSAFEVAGQYTFMAAKNLADPSVKLTDLPEHKVIGSLTYEPWEAVKLIPSLEHNSNRFVSNTIQLSGFTLLNLKAAYQATEELSFDLGATNLADENYSLSDGFPNPGRQYFANLNLEF